MMLARMAVLTAAAILFARRGRAGPKARRVVRISRVVRDLDRAEAFYREALGFRTLRRGPADLVPGGVAADQVVMRLGDDEIALVRFPRPGRRYPRGSRSDDLWFQHLAIVASDMGAAYDRLAAVPGWHAITQGGPQTLPPATGGVRAFKFRDPDGHPLELIWFPPGQGRAVWHQGAPTLGPTLGIDHTALAVADSARSVRFFRRLGLRVEYRSRNHGPAQSRLDAIEQTRVSVTGLRPAAATGPGVELLGYHPPGRRRPVRLDDDATDWVTFACSTGPARAVRDPSGHRILLVAQRGAPALGPAT